MPPVGLSTHLPSQVTGKRQLLFYRISIIHYFIFYCTKSAPADGAGSRSSRLWHYYHVNAGSMIFVIHGKPQTRVYSSWRYRVVIPKAWRYGVQCLPKNMYIICSSTTTDRLKRVYNVYSFHASNCVTLLITDISIFDLSLWLVRTSIKGFNGILR